MTQHVKTLLAGVLICEERIPEIKKHLAFCLGNIQPAARMEIFARFVGYRTYASLLAALSVRPIPISQVDISTTMDFCVSRSVVSNEKELLFALN